MKRYRKILFLISIITSFIFGGFAGHYYPHIETYIISKINISDNSESQDLFEGFSVVMIRSSSDDSLQPAYFFAASPGNPKPLIVSLHTWSGSYSQNDTLAAMAKNEEWNYIHPDFRGPNWTTDACLSEKALADIDDAIQYALDNGNVDVNNIFVVGASGGGYATLGTYLKTRHTVRAFLSWVPISDLLSWYHQSSNRKSKYAQDILHCTSDGMTLDVDEVRSRSPLFWHVTEKPKARLEIYAGINDGYTGSVPISHSILFYNHIAKHLGNQNNIIGQEDIIRLLTRGIDKRNDLGLLGNRKIYYRRDTEFLSLVIFDGGHEMLEEYCFERMQTIYKQGAILDGHSAALYARQ